MNALPLFERASVFGLAALVVALAGQTVLDGRVPASWRVWLWRVALLQSALALLPLAPLQLAVLPPSIAEPVAAPVAREKAAPFLPVPASSEPIVASATKAPSPNAPSVSSRVAPLPEVAPAPAVAPRAKRIEVQTPPVDLRLFVLAFYALGVGVQLIALARSFGRVRRLLRACTPVQDAQTSLQLREIARRMGLSRLPRLLESKGGAPFLVGLFAPAIVLPGALLTAPFCDLEAVLSHELAHLKRRDLVWNALLWPVGALLWSHPLVWIARRFLTLETESACDEMVLGSTRISPRSYGALLLNTMNTYQTPLTAGVADGSGALKTRLARLNQTPKRPRRVFKIAFVASLGGACAASVPLRLVARAQNAAPVAVPTSHPATASSPVTGVVLDEDGKPVVGATVYALKLHSQMPLGTVTSTAKGAFAFSPKVQDHFKIELFATNGQGDFAHLESYQSKRQNKSLVLGLAPGTKTTLRFTDERDRPVAGVRVSLWHLETPTNTCVAFPFAISSKIWAIRSDARGRANIATLPSEMTAQFDIGRAAVAGIRINGRPFAPLSTSKDSVLLNAPQVTKTIRLVAPVTLRGRVTFPNGRAAKGVSINAFCLDEMQTGSGKRNPDWPVWSYQMLCDAKGHYSFAGLRPGRYKIGASPQPPMDARYAPSRSFHSFSSGLHHTDVALSPGALIQGVVVSEASGKPLAGCPVYVSNAKNDFQVAPTDAHGVFHFRVVGGTQHLSAWRDYSEYGSPEAVLNAQFSTSFAIQKGQKREFLIQMPGAPVAKTTSGIVVGPDGQPVPGATVLYRIPGTYGATRSMRADGRGRFALSPSGAAHSAQLFANEGELTTAHSVIAATGDRVTLRLESGAWASAQGRVDDEAGRPVEGVRVRLSSSLLNGWRMARTDASGQFRFERLRPGTTAYFEIERAGFVETPTAFPVYALRAGQVTTCNFSMRSAPQSLSGQVLREDGGRAGGYQVWAQGSNRNISCDKEGRFLLPQVFKGSVAVFVRSPDRGTTWKAFRAQGGARNLVLRLTRANRNAEALSQIQSLQRTIVAIQTMEQKRNASIADRLNALALQPQPAAGANRQALEAAIHDLQRESAGANKRDALHINYMAQRLRLLRQKRLNTPSSTAGTSPVLGRPPARRSLLVGQIAPPLRVGRWLSAQTAPASSRGRVVCLAFDSFAFNPAPELDDFARSFAGRVRVVGIEQSLRGRQPAPAYQAGLDRAGRESSFAIAVDADPPRASRSLGVTKEAFGNARYVVIGRNGRIVCAGNELDRAITCAASASK